MKEGTRSHPIGLDDIEARLTLSVEDVAALLGLGRTRPTRRPDEVRFRSVVSGDE